MSGTTKVALSKDKVTINQCIKNDFKIMVQEAIDAMGRVLEQRKKDLETWAPENQDEFLKIFGSHGERVIPVEIFTRGISQVKNMTAREIMLDSIKRLTWIRKQLKIDDYVNMIDSPKIFCAKVSSGQESNYKVYIGINFTGRLKNNGVRACMNIMAEDSRVSTLCHEMGHFVKNSQYQAKGEWGLLIMMKTVIKYRKEKIILLMKNIKMERGK